MSTKKLSFAQIVAGNTPFKGTMRPVAARIECADGTTLSVQAGRFAYCTPRTDHGPYSTLEVGFPSVDPPNTWREYFDGDWKEDDRTGSVYGYVPVSKIAYFIRRHGGEK